MAQITCPECKTDMVAVQRKASVSGAGILGVLMTLVGLVVMAANTGIGLLIIILAVIISLFGRGTKTVMICPKCKHEGAAL